MKFSRLETRILKHIRNAFPIVFHPEEAKEIKTAEERPLPTENAIVSAFNGIYSAEDVRKGIVRLKAFECIKPVYLYLPNEFIEQNRAPGSKIRHVSLGEPKGADGYQITTFGLKVIDDLLRERIKKTLKRWVTKFIEDQLPYLLVLLLGILLTLLGINILNDRKP